MIVTEQSGYYRLYKIDGRKGLYDLSNGSLETEMIGRYDGITEIYSAEALLCEVESMLYKPSEQVTIVPIWVPENRIWWKE